MSKKAMFATFGTLSIIGLVVIIFVVSIVGGRGTAFELKERVKAQYTANQSSYDNMWKSFQEAAQVPEMQAEQFKEVYDGMISGRYAENDNLLFQMVQEQNPELGTEVYTELQNHIVAGRKEFNNDQKKIADIIREYNTYIGKHFIMNAIFQFEALDSQDYIVTSERTEKAFESGKDDAIDLNGKK